MIVHLRTPITINKRVGTVTAKGKHVPIFEKYKDTLSDTILNSGSTQYAEHYTDLTESRTFIIRFDANVNKTCQIIYNNKEYKIESAPEELEHNKYMKITASLS
jgi:SPP1 family predicted phage head-tail adaptor